MDNSYTHDFDHEVVKLGWVLAGKKPSLSLLKRITRIAKKAGGLREALKVDWEDLQKLGFSTTQANRILGARNLW